MENSSLYNFNLDNLLKFEKDNLLYIEDDSFVFFDIECYDDLEYLVHNRHLMNNKGLFLIISFSSLPVNKNLNAENLNFK